MHRFKSAILAIFQFFQNGGFEPVHEIRKKFWPKVFFWSIMKMAIRKFFHNLSQGPPNPGFMQEKVQKGNFQKKDSRQLKNFSCFRFLWISQRPGMVNWEWVVFLPSKNLYRKCVHLKNIRTAFGKTKNRYPEVAKGRLVTAQTHDWFRLCVYWKNFSWLYKEQIIECSTQL